MERVNKPSKVFDSNMSKVFLQFSKKKLFHLWVPGFKENTQNAFRVSLMNGRAIKLGAAVMFTGSIRLDDWKMHLLT